MYHLFVDNKVIKSALGLFKTKMLLRPNPAGSNFWLWLGVSSTVVLAMSIVDGREVFG